MMSNVAHFLVIYDSNFRNYISSKLDSAESEQVWYFIFIYEDVLKGFQCYISIESCGFVMLTRRRQRERI